MDKMKYLMKGFTHGGIFHADDVFSTALLKLINPEFEVIRGFAVPDEFEGIVYDIGMGEFDHHQEDKKIRENGIPYAAFGLLWKEFGYMLMDEEDCESFDEEFVQAIDFTDNTGVNNLLSQIISDLNPNWDENDRSVEKAFEEAVDMAMNILARKIKNVKAKRAAYADVRKQALECAEQYMVLAEVKPWKEAVVDLDIVYVIYESLRGGYNVQGVPKIVGKGAVKKPFPRVWRGEVANRLQNITGVGTIGFCHPSGYLCVTKTLEDAKKVASLAIEYNEKEN